MMVVLYGNEIGRHCFMFNASVGVQLALVPDRLVFA